MAYELPKDLKYKEKVLANLTWKQTLYLGTGIITAASAILIQGVPLPVKAAVSTIALTVSTVFAFTKLESRLKDRYVFHNSVTEAGYLDQEAYDFLEIQKLEENGVAVRKDGTRLAFIEVEPVNLEIKTRKETETIIRQYENFLNSINFPIHINIKTIDALNDIEDYFDQYQEKVEAQVTRTGNKDHQDYFEHYKEFWNNYIEEEGIKTRKYYIIIPSNKENRVDAVKQLERRTELVREKLPAQLASTRLTSFEITRMLASYFGDFVEIENAYFSPLTLSQRKIQERRYGEKDIE